MSKPVKVEDVLNEYQIQAMEALLSLNEAINSGNLSIGDIKKAIELAVVKGHEEKLIIPLHMALRAVVMANER